MQNVIDKILISFFVGTKCLNVKYALKIGRKAWAFDTEHPHFGWNILGDNYTIATESFLH